jgi:hypothetical protein
MITDELIDESPANEIAGKAVVADREQAGQVDAALTGAAAELGLTISYKDATSNASEQKRLLDSAKILEFVVSGAIGTILKQLADLIRDSLRKSGHSSVETSHNETERTVEIVEPQTGLRLVLREVFRSKTDSK